MTLRTKLVLSFTGLLLAVIAGVGIVATRSLEGILVNQVDATLEGFVRRGPRPPAFDDTNPSDSAFAPPGDDQDLLREVAELLLSPAGTIAAAQPSGFTDSPDPLPAVGDLTDSTDPQTIPSEDGSLEFRAVANTMDDGWIVVHAMPLNEVADATSALLQTLLLAGGGVLIIGGVATWWTVRSAMRPVEEMIGTAESIAGGDLSSRVLELPPNTELGRLGNSLNEMLSHLEHAVETERESNHRMRRFLADASHELRTPLTALRGYAELKRKGGLADREAEDRAWARIESEGNRMGTLVEDLLAITRLGEGQPLDCKPVDLARLAIDAAADHAVIDQTRPIDVDAPARAIVAGDQNRLSQVIANLLSNARVHTPEGTHIAITVVEDGGGVSLTVADDGPGIPQDSIDRVFERFHRGDASRSRASGGNGLGLAIVDSIVGVHGGTVSARNRPTGGAEFRLTLPRGTVH